MATYMVSWSTVAATRVEPMPSRSGSLWASRNKSSLVFSMAFLRAVTGLSLLYSPIQRTMVSTTNRDAKSPALCPPMPSATIKRLESGPTGVSDRKIES